MQLIKEYEYEEAIAIFNRVLEINPNHIAALVNLAFTLFRTQRPRPALAAYRQALKLLPNHPAILNDMGNCFKALGDFPKAATLFEKAFKLQPDNIHSLYNISSYDHSNTEVAGRLLALYQQPECIGEPRMLVCFALGNIYEGRKEYRTAFQYYDEANRLQAALMPYNEAKYFSYYDGLRKLLLMPVFSR